MDIKTLLNDIKSCEYLKSIFRYYSDEYIEKITVPYLIENPRWEGQPEIVMKVEWLFETNHSLYKTVGILDDVLWFVDDEGEMDKEIFNIYNLPFHLTASPLECDWRQRKIKVLSFLYYFDYCEKNNINLDAENFKWKKELEKYRTLFQKRENNFIKNLVHADYATKDLFHFDSNVIDVPKIRYRDEKLQNPLWVFHTKSKNYQTVGIDDVYVCVIDSNGRAYRTGFDIFNFPFYVNNEFRVKPENLSNESISKLHNYIISCVDKNISLNYELHNYYGQIPKNRF